MSGRRRHRVLLGKTATLELQEALDSLEKRSAGGAVRLLDAINACIRRLAAFPESAPVDPRAPVLSALQPDARGHATHEAGHTIRYAFPVQYGGDAKVLLILSIRHSKRRPLDNPEYVRRFLKEVGREIAKLR